MRRRYIFKQGLSAMRRRRRCAISHTNSICSDLHLQVDLSTSPCPLNDKQEVGYDEEEACYSKEEVSFCKVEVCYCEEQACFSI